MRDEDISFLIRARDQEGLSSLFDKYGKLIIYIVKNTGCSNEEDISECSSDILYAIWKRISKYDEAKSSFKTWIVIVARGCAINYLRKNRKHKNQVPIEDIKELYLSEDGFEAMDYDNIIESLQELPPPDNIVFYRRFVLGESVPEIAKLLNQTADSIYKRITRGKEKLKNLMTGEGFINV